MEELKQRVKEEINTFIIADPDIFNDSVIDLFFEILLKPIADPFIPLNGLQTRVPNALHKILVENINNTDKFSFFPELAKIEPFFKKIIYYIDVDKFNDIENNKSGLAASIDFLGLNPSNLRLSKTFPLNVMGYANFIEHILRSYHLRNIESHQCKNWSNKDLYQNVESVLVTYLYTIYLHFDILSSIIKPKLNFDLYLNEVVSDFEIWKERFVHITGLESFDEIPIHAVESEDWGDNERKSLRSGKIDDLRRNIEENVMVILGEPGMGKSTTLQYISYNDAKELNVTKELDFTRLPVYIELKLLSKNESIIHYCSNKLKLEVDQFITLLNEGKILLLLDGLNEVFNESRKPIREEIQKIIIEFKKVFVIITSRPLAYSNEFKNVPVFNLQKLDDLQVEEFLVKNCTVEGIRSILIKEINQNSRLSKIVRVPLLLKMLVNVVLNNGGKIPDSKTKIIYHFIENLYKRENEKHIETVDLRIINRLLSFLGHQTRKQNASNVGWRIEQFETVIENRIEKSRFNINVYEFIDMAVDLHILVKDGEKYSFIHELYQEYFASEELFRLNPVNYD